MTRSLFKMTSPEVAIEHRGRVAIAADILGAKAPEGVWIVATGKQHVRRAVGDDLWPLPTNAELCFMLRNACHSLLSAYCHAAGFVAAFRILKDEFGVDDTRYIPTVMLPRLHSRLVELLKAELPKKSSGK